MRYNVSSSEQLADLCLFLGGRHNNNDDNNNNNYQLADGGEGAAMFIYTLFETDRGILTP